MDKNFPCKISSDGRYFVDDQGRPFFWLGDTAWPLFTQYSREDAEAYLKNRSQLGFTVIQGVIGWFGGPNPDPSGLSPNCYQEYPWQKLNPASPNPAFFKHVDHLLRVAEELGLTLAILPTWGNFVTDQKIFSVEIARQYGQWLGKRYKDCPNLVWINGGDCLPHGFEEIFDALGEGLKQGDGGSHLMTYHPCHWHSSSMFFHERPWLDFNMIQVWTDWHKTYDGLITDSLLTPRKPSVIGEGAYENGPEYARGPITPMIVRRQAWWSFMAGGFYTYGQDQLWRVPSGWINSLNTPGAEQMGVMKGIVNRLPWWQSVPDQGIFETGINADETLNAAVRSLDRQWALAYLSSRCQVQVRFERLVTPKTRVTWIDPKSGQRKEAGVFDTYSLPGVRQVRHAHYQWFKTPDYWEDALLLLEGVDV